jgi:hypothetical protein
VFTGLMRCLPVPFSFALGPVEIRQAFSYRFWLAQGRFGFEPAAFPCLGQEFPAAFPVNRGDMFGVALSQPAQGLCVFVHWLN